MVWESLQGNLYFVTFILALLTAVLGIIVVSTLFKDKLKELFSDIHFFIFFFLAFGYVCFALAELYWYLAFKMSGEMPMTDMSDLYWAAGSIFLLIAFVALAVNMFKQQGESSKGMFLGVLGIVIVAAVIGYTYSINLAAGEPGENVFFSYFYPVVSSLILVFSMSVLLFWEKAGRFRNSLQLLFFANIAFLLGDLLYTYLTLKGGYGLVGGASDILYILAYLFCSVSFFTLVMHVREYANGKSLEV